MAMLKRCVCKIHERTRLTFNNVLDGRFGWSTDILQEIRAVDKLLTHICRLLRSIIFGW